MKTLYSVALTALLACFFAACKKDDAKNTTPPVAAYGKVQIVMSNEIDGASLSMGTVNYKNAAGNKYSVELLKYYMTNFTLIKADGTERNFRNYQLIDASDSATFHFALDSVANGEYTSVRFYLGVDSARNHTGAQDGALDPVNGMIWTWNTGYIFFKHEGHFIDTNGVTQSLVYHLGTDAALTSVTVPIQSMQVAGNSRRLFLKFNLNSVYAKPAMINFNDGANRMSSGRDEIFWISAMSANLKNAFQYSKAD